MNSIKYFKSLALVFVLFICSCGNDPDINVTQEEAFEKLAGSWTLGATGSIVVDDTDVSANYPGFSLSFTDGAYNTTNAGDLFASSGTWEWVDEDARLISLDGGQQVTINSLTENLFDFSFSFSGNGGVRSGIAGNYNVRVIK